MSEPSDAYEWSFVAVPAQVNAGVIKNYNNKSPNSNIFNFVINSTNISEIKKSFDISLENQKACLISQPAIKSLTKYIFDLEKDSLAAKDFILDLKNQVYKLMSVTQPFLSQESINNIIKNLSYQELKSLKSNLSSKSEFLNIKPQLTPLTPNNFDQEENTMFKI